MVPRRTRDSGGMTSAVRVEAVWTRTSLISSSNAGGSGIEPGARASRAVAKCGVGTESAAAHLTGSWRSIRNGCNQYGGRLRSRSKSSSAASSQGGTDAVPGDGYPGGPERARGRPPDSRLREQEPRAPAPACRRTRRILRIGQLHRCFLFRCPGGHCLSHTAFAKARSASSRTSSSASRSEISAPGSSRPTSLHALPSAAACTAPRRCRVRSAPDPRSGSPAPEDRGPDGPRCGCPAPPSGCPGHARWRPPSSRAAGARVEPELLFSHGT